MCVVICGVAEEVDAAGGFVSLLYFDVGKFFGGDGFTVAVVHGDGDVEFLAVAVWKGVDVVVFLRAVHRALFGLPAVHASVARRGIQRTAASRVIELHGFCRIRYLVVDVQAHHRYGTLGRNGLFRSVCIHLQGGVLTGCVGTLVVVECHFLRRRHGGVACSVVRYGHKGVGALLEGGADGAEVGPVAGLVDVLYLAAREEQTACDAAVTAQSVGLDVYGGVAVRLRRVVF